MKSVTNSWPSILFLWAPFLVLVVIALVYAAALWRGKPVPDTGASEVVPLEGPAAPATAAPNAPQRTSAPAVWATYHGDAALTGAVDAVLPETPSRKWHFQTNAPVLQTPVACADRIFVINDKGYLYALDFDGEELWSKPVAENVQDDDGAFEVGFEAPLACFGSTVFAASTDGILYAIDAMNGDQRWTYDVGSPVLGSVNTYRTPESSHQDRLFVVGQAGGALHCLDLNTGKLIWKTDETDRCDGSPSVGKNVVAFGSCAAALHLFDVEDGTPIRDITFDDDSQVAGGVALLGDSLFTGSRSGKLFHASAATGAIIWTNEDSDDEVFTTPAVNDDWVLFGSSDGNLYALDRATGTLTWKFDAGAPPSSPVIAGDKAVVSAEGKLLLFRLSSGQVLWSVEVSDAITSPAIVAGHIIVGGDDGAVTAFG